MLRKWALAQSFGMLLLITFVPFNLIFADGAEGITKIGQGRIIVHVAAIKAHGATGEENAFHFLPLLVLLPSDRVGRLELGLIELERKGAWLIGLVPCFRGGIEMRM